MIGNQIRSFRKSCNMTQSELADMLSITQVALCNYETGNREPNIETIKKLCKIFDCTTDELLEFETQSQRNKIQIKKKK